MSDLGYWLVMAGLAVVVVLATGGVTAYAYFSEDRWSKPREVLANVQDKVTENDPAAEADETADERRDLHRVGA